MAKPTKTIADARRKVGKNPKVREATDERFANDPMVQDMRRFQAGEMSVEEFVAKWGQK